MVSANSLRFRLGSVPVVIRPSVVVMLALIGLLVDSTPSRVMVWTVIGVGSILVHEMGHAVVALVLGGRPSVQLMGLGGATDPGLSYRPGRMRSALLSLAGPGAGLAIGALLWVVADPDVGALSSEDDTGSFALATALWMNIGWSVLNLVPVLPLDGGRLLVEALPGDPVTRSRRAYLGSAAVGMAVALGLLALGEPFAGILFGFLASQSFTMWRVLSRRHQHERTVEDLQELRRRLGAGDRRAESELRSLLDDPAAATAARTILIDHLARSDRVAEADELSRVLTGATPTATFLVEVMRSHGVEGVESLIEAFRRAPSEPAVEHLVLGMTAAGRDDELVQVVETTAASTANPGLVHTAQLAAHRAEAFAPAAALGAALYRLEPRANGLAAFNVACSLVRGGQPEAAMPWLAAAVQRGLPDPSMLDDDPDLEPLRGRRDFGDLRRRAFEL